MKKHQIFHLISYLRSREKKEIKNENKHSHFIQIRAAGVLSISTRSCWRAAGVFWRSVCLCVQKCVCPLVAAGHVTVKVHSNSWRAGWKTDTPIHISLWHRQLQLGFEPLTVGVSCQSGLLEQSTVYVMYGAFLLSISDRQVRMWQEERDAIMIQTAVCRNLTKWTKKNKSHEANYIDVSREAENTQWTFVSLFIISQCFLMFDLICVFLQQCVWLTAGDLPQQRHTETKVPLCCFALTTWFHRR